jgi:soluble lytic murein transglycosylase-like protein
MRKLVLWNGALVSLAGWALLMHWPMVGQPKVIAKEVTPKAIEKEVKHEHAVREAQAVLAAYDCGDDYSDAIARHALAFGLPPRLVAADIAIESSCRTNVVSSAHAIGLMQINVRVWKTDGDLTDPEINIAAGTRILAAQIHAHGTREGLRRYFGVTEGSTKSDEYADRVLYAARR